MVTDTWDHSAGSNYARVICDDKVKGIIAACFWALNFYLWTDFQNLCGTTLGLQEC